jgi:hypothetical protein
MGSANAPTLSAPGSLRLLSVHQGWTCRIGNEQQACNGWSYANTADRRLKHPSDGTFAAESIAANQSGNVELCQVAALGRHSHPLRSHGINRTAQDAINREQ